MFTLYIIYTLSFFLHFGSRFSVLAQARFDLILALVLSVISVIKIASGFKTRKLPDPAKKLILLLLFIVLSLPFVEWPGSVVRFGFEDYSKGMLFFFFSLAFINDERKLRLLVYVFLACQVFRIMEPTYLHITSGYWGSRAHAGGEDLLRLSGAPHDVINPNQLAWVILTTIPFIFYLFFGKGVFWKIAIAGLFVVFCYAFLLTGSRSGFVCLLILIAGMIFLGERKKKAVILIGLIVVPSILIILGGLSLQMSDRYKSIFDSQTENRSTFDGRIEGLKSGFRNAFTHNPIFGSGLGTSKEANWNYYGHRQISHNLYIEVIQELGILGFILFSLYAISIVQSLMIKESNIPIKIDKLSFIKKIGKAVQAWLIMHLVYSMSCFGLSSWEWYFFGGIASICRTLSEHKKQKADVRYNGLGNVVFKIGKTGN